MKKIKKNSFLKKLDSVSILFGMLSNFGIVVISVIFLNLLSALTNISTGNIFLDILISHAFISIAIFSLIENPKSFKIGYILGFILIVSALINFAL